MTAELIARVRQEQTKNQLELVRSEIDEELSAFINHDVLGLHRTQLQAVKSVLDVAVTELSAHLDDIQSGLDKLQLEW